MPIIIVTRRGSDRVSLQLDRSNRLPMRSLFLTLSVLVATSVLGWMQPASAQSSAQTVFVKSRLGLTQYTGENSPAPLTTGCHACTHSAYGVAGEVGLQWSRHIGVSVAYQTASYPFVAASDAMPSFYTRNYRVRETVQLLTQYRFPDLTPRLTPYLQMGLHVTAGRTPLPEAVPHANGQLRVAERWAFGPSFSAGLDVNVNRYVAVFAEVATNVAFPGDALDGQGRFLGVDRLSWAGVGLRINSMSLPTRFFNTEEPSRSAVPSARAPTSLTVDEVGRFDVETADSDPDAERFRWTFGDGTTREGRTVTKQFSAPGTYRIAVHRADATEPLHTFQVRVRPDAVPLQIDAINTTPDTLRPGESIVFEPVLQRGMPVEYRWHFGDGTVAFTREPVYAYSAPGVYDVTLEVMNAAGSVTTTRTLTVKAPSDSRVAAAPYRIQLGAFSSVERAERFVHRHTESLPKTPTIHRDEASGHYRVVLPYAEEADAARTLRRLRNTMDFADAFMRHEAGPDAAAPSVADGQLR